MRRQNTPSFMRKVPVFRKPETDAPQSRMLCENDSTYDAIVKL